MYAALRVLDPPGSEPVTIDQARRHCRIDNDYDDDLLQMYLTSARTWAETWLNRALFTTKLQYNVTWSPPPTATPLVPQSLIVFPLNWPPLVKRPIELPRAPAVSVEQIMWGPIDDMRLADPEDYDLNLNVEPGYIAVKPQLLPRIPQQSMVIDYTAGNDPADLSIIPAPIRHAILIGAANAYENRGDIAAEMPAAFYRLLDPWRLWTFAG
jgi:Phage gp6-like head-tail connector protein